MLVVYEYMSLYNNNNRIFFTVCRIVCVYDMMIWYDMIGTSSIINYYHKKKIVSLFFFSFLFSFRCPVSYREQLQLRQLAAAAPLR